MVHQVDFQLPTNEQGTVPQRSIGFTCCAKKQPRQTSEEHQVPVDGQSSGLAGDVTSGEECILPCQQQSTNKINMTLQARGKFQG